jgi:hypothetical protein
MSAGGTVARPKKRPGRPRKDAAGAKVIGLRSSAEWAEWLERVAKHCRTDIAKLIDVSVVEYARARGFKEEAPER